jgi:hypothetical protein
MGSEVGGADGMLHHNKKGRIAPNRRTATTIYRMIFSSLGLSGGGAQRGIGKLAALWYLRNFHPSPSCGFNKVSASALELSRWKI